jgi:hypothetical protein
MFDDPSVRKYLAQNLWLENYLDTCFWKPRGLKMSTAVNGLNVEEMLTCIREWDQERQRFPDLKDPEYSRFRRNLFVLIQRAVFVAKSSKAAHLNEVIRTFDSTFKHVTWASFNWDCLLEASFWYTKISSPRVTFDLRDWYGHSSRHLFLKLHGGVNWWNIDGHPTYLRFTGDGPLVTQWDSYEARTCGNDEPIILEPSFYKYEGPMYKLLRPQWDELLFSLLVADCVLVLGYSLPDGDSQARSTLLTAFQNSEQSRWAVVDPSPAALDRYKRFFGERRVVTIEETLEAFCLGLGENLRRAFPYFRDRLPVEGSS